MDFVLWECNSVFTIWVRKKDAEMAFNIDSVLRFSRV